MGTGWGRMKETGIEGWGEGKVGDGNYELAGEVNPKVKNSERTNNSA